jgi:hypothetical protein
MAIDPAIDLPVDPLLRRLSLAVGPRWTPGWYVPSRVVTLALRGRWGRQEERFWREDEPERELSSGGSFRPHEPQSKLTPN